MRIPGIGPWVSRIDWCKGHWCGPTHIVRLSRVRSKTGKKMHFLGGFACFSTLHRTTWWPYRLSHINALHINLSYPHKTIPWSSCKKYWEFGGSESLSFFESAIMNFCFWFDFFFAVTPWKSVKIHRVEWMGLNFGFQLKITHPKHFWTEFTLKLWAKI